LKITMTPEGAVLTVPGCSMEDLDGALAVAGAAIHFAANDLTGLLAMTDLDEPGAEPITEEDLAAAIKIAHDVLAPGCDDPLW